MQRNFTSPIKSSASIDHSNHLKQLTIITKSKKYLSSNYNNRRKENFSNLNVKLHSLSRSCTKCLLRKYSVYYK